VFTSGSTDLPRPVYRSTAKLLAGAAAIVDAFRLPREAGVVAALPIARGFGFVHGLLVATLTGGTLGLVERYDPHAVFGLCATGSYQYWPATPVMIDALRRCPWPEPLPPLPAFYVVATRPSRPLRQAFERRFGVPLRQTYGTTETGPVTLDRAVPAAVRSDTAGPSLADVTVAVGDDPSAPAPPGTPGRVWVRTSRYMDGYGFPPDVTRPESRAGWWPTQDVGHLDEGGYLHLVGRLDECVRTASGYLVNPSEIAGAVEGHPGVTDSAVVPLDTDTGPALAVLVEGAAGVTVESVHRHLNARLPLWSRPRIVQVIGALPRLPGGKADRRECIALLRALLD
jgi:acyl-CoA synthetase (AMP-forming)/AMP-acid ligase II